MYLWKNVQYYLTNRIVNHCTQVVFIFLSVALLNNPAQAINFGNNDASNPIQNAVVRITHSSGGRTFLCTGTLIKDDVVLTAGHCFGGRATPHEDALPQCGDWEIPGQWYDLQSPATIGFGNDRQNFLTTRQANKYNMPGCRDIIMLKLNTPVPQGFARPMRVINSAGIQEGARDFSRFRGQTFEIIGWGLTETNMIPRFRKTQRVGYANTDDIYAWVANSMNSVTRGGDSGGPLIWVRGSEKVVIGVDQGPNAALTQSRFTPTFSADIDDIPHIGDWIRRVTPSSVYCRDVYPTRAGMLPLVSWWSPDRKDNFATTDATWAGCNGDVKSPDYAFVRTEGFIFSPYEEQPEGTVPIYTWWDPDRGDNHLTSHPGWQHYIGDGNIRSPNYIYTRLEGYIYSPYKPQPAGTIPLYHWYSRSRGDNWTTTQFELAGISSSSLEPDYDFVRLAGYVYPHN
jgi:hypothetical protein